MSVLDENVEYKIIKIEPSSYSINIPDDFTYSKEEYKLKSSVSLEIKLDLEINRLSYVLNFKLSSSKRDGSPEILELFELKALSVFVIDDLESHVKISGDVQDLNQDFVYYFLEIATSHARGMQSTILKGTPLASFLVPSVNRDKAILNISSADSSIE
jgi:hypothetical protein